MKNPADQQKHQCCLFVKTLPPWHKRYELFYERLAHPDCIGTEGSGRPKDTVPAKNDSITAGKCVKIHKSKKSGLQMLCPCLYAYSFVDVSLCYI